MDKKAGEGLHPPALCDVRVSKPRAIRGGKMVEMKIKNFNFVAYGGFCFCCFIVLCFARHAGQNQ
jgi:hypothetical protein